MARPRGKSERDGVRADEEADIVAALDDITTALRDLDIGATPRCLAQFRAYIETLLLWRRRVSLTAASSARAVARDHVVDSLAVARLVRPGMRVADIGSGAGLPGMPIAIVCPAARVVLIEPRRKRANFLRDAARQAGASNVEVAEDRVETLVANETGSFDLVVCRAFGSLDAFLRLALPLLNRGGMAVAMKGPRGIGEAAATKVSDYGEPEVVKYRLPTGAEHLLLLYRRRIG